MSSPRRGEFCEEVREIDLRARSVEQSALDGWLGGFAIHLKWMTRNTQVSGEVSDELGGVSPSEGTPPPPEDGFEASSALARLAYALEREKQAREEAERAVSLNDLFVAILGHDLRNPLGAILVGAQHLERIATTEGQLRNASRIVSSAERMARMIDQLLDFTRIRAGRGLTMDFGPVRLSELCERTLEELGASHPTRRVDCRYEGDVVGVWDADRLLQVLSNLVANAMRHGVPDEPIVLAIDGTAPDEVTVRVENHGLIPAALLPNVFDPFRRDDRRDERKCEGLGLGLYITRQIVESHGGTITVTSAPGEGTRFTFVLPRHPVRLGLRLQGLGEESPGVPRGRSPGRRRVVLEEQAPAVLTGDEAVEDRIEDARGAVDDVEGR